MIKIEREIITSFEEGMRREWLVTNGIGGYASGTIIGANTRRYHGLLVASLDPPVDRLVMLAKMDEEVTLDGSTYYLGTNEYPDDKLNPAGFVHLEDFSLDHGIAIFSYHLGLARLEKRIWMAQGKNTTYVQYTATDTDSPLELTLRPFANFRDYHNLTHGSLDWNFQVTPASDDHSSGCEIQAYPAATPYFLLTSQPATIITVGVWYWHFVYRAEQERGLDYMEDLYAPCIIKLTLNQGDSVAIIASSEARDSISLDHVTSLKAAQNRPLDLLHQAQLDPAALDPELCPIAEDQPISDADIAALQAELTLAADQFIVSRHPVKAGGDWLRTVIAGYHWFTDWGRDTMISLPGLCLQTGRSDEAATILRSFAEYIDGGMLPNFFPDAAQTPEYNTVDATLWYYHAIEQHLLHTGDDSVARDLFPKLADIIRHHINGTRYNIKVDPNDGLLYAGQEGVQLTWMDAKVGDWVVTPRIGKPVEINALWHHALMIMARLRQRGFKADDTDLDYAALAQKAAASFRARFWCQNVRYLYDVVDGPSGDDDSLRPNQLFAAALEPDLISDEAAAAMLVAVDDQLLTPYGLRTLAPTDPHYIGCYTGDRYQRDGAYHQGTVWPWLLGAYAATSHRLAHDPAALRGLLPPFITQMRDYGIGSVAEICEGDAPHQPKGCIAQAWSVAALLEIIGLINKH